MRESAGPGQQSSRTGQESPPGRRSRSVVSNTPPHLADFLKLQSSYGNRAMNEVLAIQRAPRRSSPDSGLVYGGPSGPTPDNYSGRVGGVRFSTDHRGRLMREIEYFVAEVAPHFPHGIGAAGSVVVNFGRTLGGRPGEYWNEEHRIVLDPSHPEAQGGHRLAGTAVFELLNAASRHRIDEWESHARNGDIERWAVREGITGAQYYAREILRIEHDNVLAHQRIMYSAGRFLSTANRFAGATGDFDTFHQRTEPDFLHTYESRYAYLRVSAASSSSLHYAESSSRGGGSGSSHRHHRSR